MRPRPSELADISQFNNLNKVFCSISTMQLIALRAAHPDAAYDTTLLLQQWSASLALLGLVEEFNLFIL